MTGLTTASAIHTVSVSIIVITYVIYAIQMASQIDWKRKITRGTVAVCSLVSVFVLCAAAGYVSDYMPRSLYWIRDGFHVALSIASIALVWTNQAGEIARLLRNSSD